LAQAKLRPAGSPTIDPIASEPGDGLAYTAVFDVFPEITLPEISELAIKRPTAEVSDADVDGMIQTLRRQRQKWKRVERAATAADRVIVDFEGEMEGQAIEGGSAEELPVALDSRRMIPGFEEGLIGAVAGEERDLSLTFPDDYQEAKLAGKPAIFHVKVRHVEESELPEVDDELAAGFGVKEGGLEAFLREVRANMERELADGIRARLKERVMEALLADGNIELPRSLVDEEVQRALAQRRNEITQMGVDAASVDLEPERFEDAARRRVALSLVLAELIKKNELKADPARVRARVETLASTYEHPDEVIAWIYADRSRLEPIESGVLEDQVVDWVLERAKVENEPTSFDALLNPGQTSSTP